MNEQLSINIDDATIYISLEITEIWNQYRQISPKSNEACGILIGSQLQDTKTYQLEYITTPQKQDIRSRFNFVMKDSYHQSFLDQKYLESNGTSIYLGTWHSHPQKIPIPSSIDIDDWRKCIMRNSGRNLFFIIIGTQEVKIYYLKDNDLHISTILRF
ncbi:Mov34/MPN/PAD-1 family protein [Acinetobacter sp. CWB-G5]|uniref:Mov34/MPN/PAD-1 family protein n=1 Tax=Acinetobacter sp. CWB-G5 TaxID=2855444 RepID=UPI001C454936|nr:Mov34/MPN/PAD-1 family protein [Acinetobacter sp. CWB-G5]MBV7310198.1 Mov34/MPN/PAD-1 family protein [Acinetobacter sp. CWB-G5]